MQKGRVKRDDAVLVHLDFWCLGDVHGSGSHVGDDGDVLWTRAVDVLRLARTATHDEHCGCGAVGWLAPGACEEWYVSKERR